MPHHDILHKLKAHPKFNHTKRRLSNFIKTHPKTSSFFSSDPTRYEISAVMQGEGIMHRIKKLHPLKLKI